MCALMAVKVCAVLYTYIADDGLDEKEYDTLQRVRLVKSTVELQLIVDNQFEVTYPLWTIVDGNTNGRAIQLAVRLRYTL